ncbi:MAG TPA: HNH endonuclease [Xanthobacteraceae bacterium]|nr:HNH endonuclease [Xanthobacteraceae bacterium]
MGVKQYDRHSAKVIRDKRWPALRLAAKRRDGFKCVKCRAVGRLEVDHIKRVKDAPELAFELSNLQTLCTPCHSAKTRLEVGFGQEVDPKRAAWRDLVAAMAQPQQKENLSCLNL